MRAKAYEVQHPDYDLSPFSGMTRKHYLDLGKYLLDRAFVHVKDIEDPIVFPDVPGKTYPQPNAPEWRHRSNEFETLERTFTVAGPLIHAEPDIEIRGIKLRDYYLRQFYRALTPGFSNSLPLPNELPDATYQFTCEFGGLFKTLLLLPDVLWPHYTKEEQDAIAHTVYQWAHHRTTQNNWRIFNITSLSFLKKVGYEIDDDLLKSHLMWVVSYHSGDGWYLEQTYNYYTISLFIVYCTIWSRSFGDEHYPEIAKVIERSAYKLMETYCNFFGRDGYINMWARSITYRTWISGGFPVSFMLKDGSPLDPGWARRLCSGSLLQFVSREDFFENDVPALGFYGQKEFMLQSYSCAGSPYLMFLPFIALALPEDSPFWTAKENEGIWEKLGESTHLEILAKPGLVLANHGRTGTSEIIPGKVYYNDPNYSKLCFNTHFPWEDHDPDGGTAMEYAFKSLDPRDLRGDDINFYLTGKVLSNDAEQNHKFTISESMLYNGYRGGVIYRQSIMRKPPNNGVGYIIDLAEIVVPGGVIRVDRSRLAFEHELTLGNFGVPHLNGTAAEVKTRVVNGAQVIIAEGSDRSVAMILYTGWDSLESKVHRNMNAESDESTVVFARKKRTAKNPAMELMICAMLHKREKGGWSDEELSPIADIRTEEITDNYSALGAVLRLQDGKEYRVDYADIDGYKTC